MRKIGDNTYIPDEGYKYISDGMNYGIEVRFGKNADKTKWYDTNDEPFDPEDDNDPTAEDYENALAELGVK